MKRTIQFLLPAIMILLTLSLKATIVTVNQTGFTFNPKTFSITVGDTIRWQWSAGIHTTTSVTIPTGAAAWDNPLTAESPQFEYRVTVAGTYDYKCTPHAALGMTGSFTATGSLGIEDNPLLSSVKIFPNPATENTSLMLTSDKTGRGLITMYDLLGNKVNYQEVDIKSGTNNIPLSLESIIPGIYFIELKYNDNLPIVRRFVKSR
jgi:plastocyanin